jgi:hypothetical protein
VILAMSIEIHAAIIGGVIAGSVVLVGVLFTEWLARRRGHRQRLRAAVQEIIITLPIYLSFISTDPPPNLEPGISVGTPGFGYRDTFIRAVFEAEAETRRFRFRHREEVRAAIDELLTQTAAADIRFYGGQLLSREDLYQLTEHNLSSLVYGGRALIDDDVSDYVRHGFTPP